uniref:ZZ-type domain-containing protein n=1 Tax=Chromera velia CCMP2878 TaxID=1169474 RepID=A0A0G4GN26_9ALVE|eukprot:Cvel_22622.t1-p1 / transcript=Cvel_22622.t1 / gene=Cvel_22622 / organism=Chromera_velia_CCMP2878 / gene_product=E3 ubiquitin-protein ligase Zswim2, putative / transcript_product=E3 ubiquitin-protein ligase Zswim2, putative / location=Cvel_scaffold2241:8996-12756(-) / protein_length=776 / sequence_SO=supercontig / SO=protein_coding / is_pseudo=false
MARRKARGKNDSSEQGASGQAALYSVPIGVDQKKGHVKRVEVEEDDCCPICQEPFLGNTKASSRPLGVAWCASGCGSSLHLRCMLVWAEHRCDWGPDALSTISQEASQADKVAGAAALLNQRKSGAEGTHFWSVCRGCKMAPVRGPLYRCLVCRRYCLCQQCFERPSMNGHDGHPFARRETSKDPWVPAERVYECQQALRKRLKALHDALPHHYWLPASPPPLDIHEDDSGVPSLNWVSSSSSSWMLSLEDLIFLGVKVAECEVFENFLKARRAQEEKEAARLTGGKGETGFEFDDILDTLYGPLSSIFSARDPISRRVLQKQQRKKEKHDRVCQWPISRKQNTSSLLEVTAGVDGISPVSVRTHTQLSRTSEGSSAPSRTSRQRRSLPLPPIDIEGESTSLQTSSSSSSVCVFCSSPASNEGVEGMHTRLMLLKCGHKAHEKCVQKRTELAAQAAETDSKPEGDEAEAEEETIHTHLSDSFAMMSAPRLAPEPPPQDSRATPSPRYPSLSSSVLSTNRLPACPPSATSPLMCPLDGVPLLPGWAACFAVTGPSHTSSQPRSQEGKGKGVRGNLGRETLQKGERGASLLRVEAKRISLPPLSTHLPLVGVPAKKSPPSCVSVSCRNQTGGPKVLVSPSGSDLRGGERPDAASGLIDESSLFEREVERHIPQGVDSFSSPNTSFLKPPVPMELLTVSTDCTATFEGNSQSEARVQSAERQPKRGVGKVKGKRKEKQKEKEERRFPKHIRKSRRGSLPQLFPNCMRPGAAAQFSCVSC